MPLPERAQLVGADPPDASEQMISAREFLSFIWRHKWPIIVLGILLGAAAFAIASALPRKYRAVAVIIPSEALSSDSSSGIMSQLGGLAQVAGISLGSGGNSAKDEAYEFLHSQTLAASFIAANNLAPLMFAKRWDANTSHWKSDGPGEPSLAEQVSYFNSKVSAVSQDKLAGTVHVAVTWRDRELASKWTNELITMANDQLRARRIKDASQMVDYLTKQLQDTQSNEVRQALYALMERELRRGAIANVSREYAFRVIDPAIVPDVRDWVSPVRGVYALVGFLIGALAGAALGHARASRARGT